MKAKQLRGVLMQAVFSWVNNSKFNGSDTEGKPVVLRSGKSTKKKLLVQVRSGFAGSPETDLYEVTIKVRRVEGEWHP